MRLYGLIHARYIITSHGLNTMLAKYRGGEFGYGPADLDLATYWISRATSQGNALAQVHLASMIGAGELDGELLEATLESVELGGARDGSHAAAELYRLAAEQGHPSGQFALGRCYRYGEGVACDVERAREWLRRAAAQGADENVAAAWATDELADLEAAEEGTHVRR